MLRWSANKPPRSPGPTHGDQFLMAGASSSIDAVIGRKCLIRPTSVRARLSRGAGLWAKSAAGPYCLYANDHPMPGMQAWPESPMLPRGRQPRLDLLYLRSYLRPSTMDVNPVPPIARLGRLLSREISRLCPC